MVAATIGRRRVDPSPRATPEDVIDLGVRVRRGPGARARQSGPPREEEAQQGAPAIEVTRQNLRTRGVEFGHDATHAPVQEG